MGDRGLSKKNMALNPQQQAFKEAYMNPESDTYSNAYKSALAAGYSEEYSQVVMGRDRGWWSEMISDLEMINLAEFALKDTMSLVPINKEGNSDAALHRVRLDAAKFALPALKREKWTPRQEIAGVEGAPIIISNELSGKYAINTSSIEDRK